MTTPALGTLDTEPAASRPDLLAAPVLAALGELTVGVAEIDAELADTAAFCAAYEVSAAASANCVVLAGKREGVVRYAAAVVLATTRADVNGVIRRLLDVRKISFAAMELAVELSGMEYGGITPIGLPADWPVFVDEAVTTAGLVVIGSGLRRSKLVLDGAALASLSSAMVVQGLATPIPAQGAEPGANPAADRVREDQRVNQTPDHVIDELMELAVRAARAAGAELMARYGKVEGLDLKSSSTDPVSDADRAAEDLLVSLITQQRPGDGLLGEEGAARESTTGITWVIDPLDGTVNYLYELDNFSVSVAAEDADGAVVGVVLDPTRDIIYTAARGRGAHCDGRKLQCAAAVPASQALLGTGFGYDPERRRRQGALIGRMLPLVRDVRRIGSAALDLSWVASGAMDAYYEEGTNRWDVAAGGLIAAEAGALFTWFTPLGLPSGNLAAAPALHAELSQLLTVNAAD